MWLIFILKIEYLNVLNITPLLRDKSDHEKHLFSDVLLSGIRLKGELCGFI